MKKEKSIVIFYILYFGWLFTLVTLTVDVTLQNYFSLAIAMFYFIFLRDYWDPLWFTLAALLLVGGTVLTFDQWRFAFDMEVLSQIPLWLPLAWGTTAVALRKFFVLLNKRID